MALTPGERKALGKRASDLIDARGLVLVSEAEYERMRAIGLQGLDKSAHERYVSILMRQTEDALRQVSDLRAEAARAAVEYLDAPCPHCGGKRRYR